jgi:hypothetical protein
MPPGTSSLRVTPQLIQDSNRTHFGISKPSRGLHAASRERLVSDRSMAARSQVRFKKTAGRANSEARPVPARRLTPASARPGFKSPIQHDRLTNSPLQHPTQGPLPSPERW